MSNTNNDDVLEFLDEIIPDTPENQLIERQELFRIALTQAMRNLRKRVGITQKELAERLGVTQSWVSKLESANNDHTFESVLAYLNALDADFKVSIFLKDKVFQVISAHLQATESEVNTAINTVLDEPKEKNVEVGIGTPDFKLISSEQQTKCNQALNLVANQGFWGGNAA